MSNIIRRFRLVAFALLSLACIGTPARAQDRMTIQATAMGTSTQLGKVYNVTITIEQFSTPDERMALIDAFTRSGQDGLIGVLEGMKAKGRVRFSSGGVGNDVKYIDEVPSENGRRIRVVTNRYVGMQELYQGTRSREYNLGVMELILTPDGKGSSGTLLPACKMTVNKKTNQIEIESYQNPWKLTHFIIHKG